MTNEIIGIVGAIGLTVLLFALRHFILPSERANKRRRVTPMTHRENHELKKITIDDNAWLLWAPDIEAESRTAGQSNEPRGQRRKGPGSDERRDDRTMNNWRSM